MRLLPRSAAAFSEHGLQRTHFSRALLYGPPITPSQVTHACIIGHPFISYYRAHHVPAKALIDSLVYIRSLTRVPESSYLAIVHMHRVHNPAPGWGTILLHALVTFPRHALVHHCYRSSFHTQILKFYFQSYYSIYLSGQPASQLQATPAYMHTLVTYQ